MTVSNYVYTVTEDLTIFQLLIKKRHVRHPAFNSEGSEAYAEDTPGTMPGQPCTGSDTRKKRSERR